eukprot:CAMPEP_0198150194 /NCGR_PEP_ID=MMETSP1443-20131203/49956_1 /TAXON_ID=186043 /ORGANISM="Entomoneis sp., Strain CCMP2396" /LENGTH=290 /DNA_ID=CAMNT_0043815441 /DNA_START=120 /DNA_END=992 /DNA_ORIENTATION=+
MSADDEANNNVAAADESKAIKTMKLYNHIDRVFNELKEFGIDDDSPVSVEILSKFDSLHYLGNEAVDNGIQVCGVNKNTMVLDLGSGIGGTARYMSNQTGCHVDALELQGDLCVAAEKLTDRCGLSNSVHQIQGNFMEMETSLGKYNAIVSFLVFLHIPDRPSLLQKCFESMAPGGTLYVEDFFQINAFTEEEQRMLREDVYVSSLPTLDEIQQQLEQVGFTDVTIQNLTERWSTHVTERAVSYKENLARNVRVHGEDGAQGLSHFYSVVSQLFQGGNLGGVVFHAKKPI